MVAHASSLALGSADAEEGVGALELLADGVALADGVVAGVEPGGREVALDAAPEFATIVLHGAIVFYISSGANSLVQ